MALLGYSFAFLLLLLIVAWIVFPRLMRFLALALAVFIGIAWLNGSTSDTPTPPRHELRR
jgi:hypothetical protein